MSWVKFTTVVLIASVWTADGLTCHCPQCQDNVCVDDLCIAEIAFNQVSVRVEQLWRCLPNTQTIHCNISSSVLTTLCCNSGDRCNQHLMPSLVATDGTVHLPTLTPSGSTTRPIVPLLRPETPELSPTPHTAEDVSTPDPAEDVSTPDPAEDVSTPDPQYSTPEPLEGVNSTVQTAAPQTISTPTLVYPPPPTSSQGGSCFRSDSSKSDNVRLCSLTTTCYSTLRRKSNGTFVKRRGCSRRPCEEETRNRMVKRCCLSTLCNIELSPENFYTEVTPSNSPTNPHSISTVATQGSTGDTVSTTTLIRPNILPPILTPEITSTENPETEIYCYCTTCPTNRCTSNIGCTTTFTVSPDGQYIYDRGCVTRQQQCSTQLSEAPSTHCCYDQNFCNQPHAAVTDPSPVYSASTTDHMTSHDPSNTNHPGASDVSTQPTILTPSQEITTPTLNNTEQLNFYFTIGTVVFVVVACIVMAIFTVILIVGCVRHRKNKLKQSATPLPKSMPSIGYHGNKYGSSRDGSASSSPSLQTTESYVSTHSPSLVLHVETYKSGSINTTV